ncbi:MAG: A/G-specific adenine glycosylase [Bacteroidota bacterium]|nr:A/G-specific adenine glycosylase [Bacteroidota bacterium]
MQIVFDILKWYEKNFRTLPWRETKDPYKIWLSEVILQQTQVIQGLSYYDKFIQKFPNIFSLAEASEEDILKNWQGLGYYSRARNLHKTAKIVSETHMGKFPETLEDIIKLPGIGLYTSAAILSMAFEKKHPVLDGNVFRFISRLYAIEIAIDEPKNRKYFIDILTEMMEGQKPSVFNNAMMEMGAMICKPQNPDCNNCPVERFCEAKKQDIISKLPIKNQKIKIKKRFFNYFLIEEADFFYIQLRTDNDIWRHLYQLPLIESEKALDIEEIIKTTNEQWNYKVLQNINLIMSTHHILTHQRIHVQFWRLKVKEIDFKKSENYIKTNHLEFKKYPIPKLIEKIILHL